MAARTDCRRDGGDPRLATVRQPPADSLSDARAPAALPFESQLGDAARRAPDPRTPRRDAAVAVAAGARGRGSWARALGVRLRGMRKDSRPSEAGDLQRLGVDRHAVVPLCPL